MHLSTYNYGETLTFGQRLGKCLQPDDIVLLYGDLGAGKTTLTKGICQGLGVSKEVYIRSPTFTLINEYSGKYPIFHIDLYRLNSFAEVEALGLEECLFSGGVCIIEWAEKLSPKSNKFPGLGIEEHIEVSITIDQETHRTLKIKMVKQKKRSLPIS